MNQPITDASVAAYLDAYRTTQTEYRTLSKPESEIAIEACRNGLRAALAVLVPSKENAQDTPEVVEPSDADLSRVYEQAFHSRGYVLDRYPKSKKILEGTLRHRNGLRAVRNLPALERPVAQDKKTSALIRIHQLVTGEQSPRWENQNSTYCTRGCIADLCEVALGKIETQQGKFDQAPATISSAPPQPVAFEAVVSMLVKRAADYAKEFGHEDMGTAVQDAKEPPQ